jgi:hypothetical protein
MNNNSSDFDKNEYMCIDNFIDDITVSTLSRYLEYKINRGEIIKQDNPEKGLTQYSYYADPLTEVLLSTCKESVEQAIGKKLLPTYSQVCVYQPNDELHAHSTRESREISVVIEIASKEESSEIILQHNNENRSFVLKSGNAIVYKGCDVKQLVKPLKSNQLNVQIILHYIDENGPYKDFVNDTRPRLGLNTNHRRI